MIKLQFEIILLVIAWILVSTSGAWAQNNFSFLNKSVVIGNTAGSQTTTGVNNVFVGYQSGSQNTTGT